MRTVLLVDDNDDDIHFAERALQPRVATGCFNIIVARDGAEALERMSIKVTSTASTAAEAALPDLVLLDLGLPKLSGIEVLKRIRQNDNTRLLPVVVFTSELPADGLIDCYAFGANSVIRKPLVSNNYNETIQHVVDYWLECDARGLGVNEK